MSGYNWVNKTRKFLSQGPGKTVVFLNLKDPPKEIGTLIRDMFSYGLLNKVTFVCFNLEVPGYLRAFNGEIELSEDYLTQEDNEGIDTFVYKKISRDWHQFSEGENNKVTEHRDIDLGSLVEYEFQIFLAPRIKRLEVVRRVVQQKNPYRIIVIEDTGELHQAASLVARACGIPILPLVSKPVAYLSGASKSIVTDIVSGVLDSLMRKRVFWSKRHKDKVIIDHRLYQHYQHYQHFADLPEIKYFLPVTFEKGLRLRWAFLKEGKLYLPPYLAYSWGGLFLANPFKRKWKALRLNRNFRNIFLYQGISMWELVEGKLEKFFNESFYRISKNIGLIDKLKQKKGLSGIVIRHDIREMEKTMVFWGRRLNIPSLVIQHGMLVEKNGLDCLFADKIAVWGKLAYDKYVSMGNEARRLYITGNPNYDELFNRRPKETREEICARLNLDMNKKIFVLTTYQNLKCSSFAMDDENEVVLHHLIEVMKEFPDSQLVVKLHPSEEIDVYKKILANFGIKGLVVVHNKDINIFDLIQAADLLITYYSSSGVEAMALGKPVVTANFGRRRDLMVYTTFNAAMAAYNSKELGEAIRATIYDPETKLLLQDKRERFVRECLFCNDNRSSRRVMDLIMQETVNNHIRSQKTRDEQKENCLILSRP